MYYRVNKIQQRNRGKAFYIINMPVEGRNMRFKIASTWVV